MRIVILNPGVRGPASYCLNLYKYLTRKGHEVLFISEAKWTKEDIPLYQAKSHLLWGLAPVVYKPWEIMRQIKEFKPDVIHHHWPCGTMDVLFSQLFKIKVPIAVTIHVSVASKKFLWDKMFYMHFGVFKRHLKRVSAVVNISHFIEGQVMKRTKLPASRHHLIYAGVDEKIFKAATPAKSDTLRLLFVGQIMPEKGIDLLVASVINARKKRKIELSIIGDGHLKLMLQKSTSKYDFIKWIGFVKDQKTIASHYAASDLTVLPTRWDEAFSLVPVESIACGTPVLATKKGGTPEVVIPGETGYLLNRPSKTLLYRQLVAIDKEDLEKMRPKCRELVMKRHTIEIWGKEHERLYKELMNQRPAR